MSRFVSQVFSDELLDLLQYFRRSETDPVRTWKPALVILRIDRAALDVKWSWTFSETLKTKRAPDFVLELVVHWEGARSRNNRLR